MEYFLILVIIIALVFLYNNFNRVQSDVYSIKSQLDKLKKENEVLKNQVSEFIDSGIIPETKKESLVVETPKPTIIPDTILPIEPESVVEISAKENSADFMPITDIPVPKSSVTVVSESVSAPKPVPSPKPIDANDIPTVTFEHQRQAAPKPIVPKEPEVYKESAFSILLKKLEAQFAENWTGILGTGIMVLGIGYLSIYTAMKVSPMFRVLLIWLYAGLLIGAYYLLKKKEKWEKTGLWLRSAGASLFLFGCFGASQVKALHFIDNQIAGYSLIAFGISLNLFIGYIIKKQTFLSLHVALSMLILCVVPDKLLVTFILASLTATAGILLSYKEKWEYHLLIVIVSFLIFDIWFNSGAIALSKSQNIFAIIGILMVFVSCMIMQYRTVYENTTFEKSAFITHLSNWILFATGLIMHSTGNHLKTFIIMVAAVICFFMALHARKRKIVWLYHLDGMISFVLMSLGIILLNDWNVGLDIIFFVLYAITLLSLFVVYKEKEILLHKIFLAINHILAIVLVLFTFFLLDPKFGGNQVSHSVTSLLILSVIGVLFVIYCIKKQVSNEVDAFYFNENYSINGLLSIVLSIFSIVLWNKMFGHQSYFYVLISFALIWVFFKQKFNTKLFDLGRILFLMISILCGIILFSNHDKNISDLIFAGLLLGVFALNWKQELFFETNFLPRFLAILGTNIMLGIFAFKYIDNKVILVLSLAVIGFLNHEFLWINFKRKLLSVLNQLVLYVFYFVGIGFAIFGLISNSVHFSDLQMGLTCLGLALIETYVLFANRLKNKSNEETKPWSSLHLINSELLVFTILFFTFHTFKIEINATILSLISVLAFLAFKKFPEFKRFQNYSFGFLVASAFFTIGLSVSEFESKSKILLYVTQIASIVFGVIYCYLNQKDDSEKSNKFSLFATYLVNIWIVALLLIQVQLVYLSLLVMSLALLNYYLVFKQKINIKYTFISILSTVAMILSLFYSFFKINGFTALDWVLQLSSVAIGMVLAYFINKNKPENRTGYDYQIVINAWLSIVMFSQLPHQWLPVYWAVMAILNLYFYHKQFSKNKYVNISYYLLANIHLGFLSFTYFETKFLWVYLLIFALLGTYIYLAYKWLEDNKYKNSFLIYPATISIACFLYLTFDKGILTFFWILEALGLLILSLMLKEKYFRYVSLSFVGICVIRLMFFDLSNANFLVRALVLLGVGVVLILMNTLFKKYKDRFD